VSLRVEHTDSLSLLRELPDGWAQTCIASPPADAEPARILAILEEVHRVLREDGTLWLLGADEQLATDLRAAAGYRPQQTPSWSTPVTGVHDPVGLSLLSKRDHCFRDPPRFAERLRPSSCSLLCGRGRPRRPECREEKGRAYRGTLVRCCILTGSSPLACGVCGAPYRRTGPGENARGARRPTCPHTSREGRCLVLDPFYRPALPTGAAALCTGRGFLGIADRGERR
jgi:hypothetical protein